MLLRLIKPKFIFSSHDFYSHFEKDGNRQTYTHRQFFLGVYVYRDDLFCVDLTPLDAACLPRGECIHTNMPLFVVVTITFFSTHLIYVLLFSCFSLSVQISFPAMPIKQTKITVERESVIFKHGEECMSGQDSVRVAQK